MLDRTPALVDGGLGTPATAGTTRATSLPGAAKGRSILSPPGGPDGRRPPGEEILLALLRELDGVWFLSRWEMGKLVGTDGQEVSLRAFLRSLPSVAIWTLLLCVSFWALLVLTDTTNRPSFWQMLLAWPAVTIWLGPIWWLRHYRSSDAAGLWLGIAVAMLWGLCVCPILIGLAYAAAAGLFGENRGAHP